MRVLSENEITESRMIFDLFDRDGDGYLDRKEFQVVLEHLEDDVSPAECLLDFEAADTAGDGYIEFKEFVQWWTN